MKLYDSVTIKAPAEKVFEVWSDVERYPEWAGPVLERRKLTEGPVRIGSMFRAVDQWPGRRMEFDMEITEFEENKRFGARWSEPMAGNWTSSLTETADGTRLDFEMETRLPPVMRLFSPILKPWAEKQNAQFMAALKHRLEDAQN